MRNASLPLLLLLLLAGCEQKASEPPAPERQPSTQPAAALAIFAGEGKNRLCLDERASRSAFITYGEGGANCTVRGTLTRSGVGATLVPDGDESCKVPMQIDEDGVRLGDGGPGCAYYCGPSASYGGATFRRTDDGQPVTDFAGQPMC